MADADRSEQRPVEFGLSLPNRAVLFGLPVDDLIGAAELAEETGVFGSVWVGDNLLSKPRLESMVTLSALAARTRRVRLGTISMATFPMRNPVLMAVQWASLDVLSGGRTILSVCNGGPASASPRHAAELAVTGVASNERVSRLEEGIEIVRRCWLPGTASYAGKYHQFDGIEALPKPVQDRVPIVIAVSPPPDRPQVEERALRRVARLADGWQTVFASPATIARQWQLIQRYADEYGRADEVGHLSQHIMVKLDDDGDRAEAAGKEFLEHYYGKGSWQTSPESLASFLAAGSPAHVADWIAARVEAGVNTPVIRFADTDQRVQLERFCTDVQPRLQRHADVVPSRPASGSCVDLKNAGSR